MHCAILLVSACWALFCVLALLFYQKEKRQNVEYWMEKIAKMNEELVMIRAHKDFVENELYKRLPCRDCRDTVLAFL